MTRIIFIRHGETDWNKNETFRGRIDVKLNRRGIEQAEAVAKALADLEFNAVCSSPLARAYDTATIIRNKHGLGYRLWMDLLILILVNGRDFHIK